jgi:hypothetical protein
MPADFSQYVDLTVYDKEPGEMYLEAIEMARLTMPEFNLRAGTVEDAIFQAMAWIGWVNATSLNRVPDRLMAGILSMMGVTLQLESPARMSVTVTANSYEGVTIPPGTLFGYTTTFEDEVNEYVFMSVESLEIPADEESEPGDPFPSGRIPCECMTPGVIPSIPPGTPLTLLSPSTSILSAEAYSDFENGVNDENSASFLSRAVSYLSSLSSTLVTGSQVDASIANTYSGLVGRVRTYDLTDGDESTGDIATPKTFEFVSAQRSGNEATLNFIGNHKFKIGDKVTVSAFSESNFDGVHEVIAVVNPPFGNMVSSSITYINTGDDVSEPIGGLVKKGIESVGNITVFVYGNGDFIDPVVQIPDILSYVSEKSLPGLIVNVRNFELLSLEVEATIVLDSNYDQQVLEQTIENSIIEYLSPSSYPTSEDVLRANQVIALISAIPGVRYVSSLSLLPGDGNWLPQFGEDLEPANKGWTPRITPDNLTIVYTVA